MRWLPIAEAPRDGTHVLLYFPTLKSPYHVGWWLDAKRREYGVVVHTMQQWSCIGLVLHAFTEGPPEATHFQLLTPP